MGPSRVTTFPALGIRPFQTMGHFLGLSCLGSQSIGSGLNQIWVVLLSDRVGFWDWTVFFSGHFTFQDSQFCVRSSLGDSFWLVKLTVLL